MNIYNNNGLRFEDEEPEKEIPENPMEKMMGGLMFDKKFIEQRISDPKDFYWIIKTLPGSEFAGTICLWNINTENKYAEVGYELLPDFQGKGIMTSALREIINFAFTKLDLEVIEAFTHAENRASKKLLESFGFRVVAGKTDPDNSNNIVYCLEKAQT